MRFKLDANLPTELASDLVVLGHDTDSVQGEGIAGATDAAVIQTATHADRILLILDKGIANLNQYPLGAHSGVVLFRPSEFGRGAVLLFVRQRLARTLDLDLYGRLTIVGPNNIRSRR